MSSPRVLGWTGALAGALLLQAPPAAAETTAVQATWHAEQARVPDARGAGRDGAGVVVAVLDGWVDAGHEDFGGRVLPGADCLGGECTDGPAAPDECEHGTHVAGTVAAASFGIATRATVLPVRVLGYDEDSGECTGRPADVTAGIRWAVSHGARVINLSLGPDVPELSGSSSISLAVEEAARAGVVLVFSAGNAGRPVADSYGRSALVVAATGPDGSLASYSQRGRGVDLAAPGGEPAAEDACGREDCVTSLFPGDRYSVAAGTSMAAPHVSGIAALLLGQDPRRTREQVLERLVATARPLADAGRGLVDARAALGVAAVPPAAPQVTGQTAPAVAAPPTPATAAPAVPTAPGPSAPAPPRPSTATAPPPPVSGAPAPVEQSSAPVAAPPPATAPLPPAAAQPTPVEPAPVVPVAVAALAVAAAGAAAAARAARRR